MTRFGEDTIREGTPLAQMEDTLVPLYLFHRYQTEAAAKEIGGLDYRYNVRGDGQKLPQTIASADQEHALASVLKTLSPEMLTLPEPLLKMLPPRPPDLPRTQESFPAETGLTFDPVGAAESAADLTLALVFNPQRANRLVEYHALDSSKPSLEDVIAATLAATHVAGGASGLTLAVKRAVDNRILEALLTLAANPEGSAETRAIVREVLTSEAQKLTTIPGANAEDRAFAVMEAARIREYFADPAKFVPAKPVTAPPGMPIGEDAE